MDGVAPSRAFQIDAESIGRPVQLRLPTAYLFPCHLIFPKSRKREKILEGKVGHLREQRWSRESYEVMVDHSHLVWSMTCCKAMEVRGVFPVAFLNSLEMSLISFSGLRPYCAAMVTQNHFSR